MIDSEACNALLPQTQCTECGYSGCLPYAQALSSGTDKNPAKCLPGGQALADLLAQKLGLPSQPVQKNPLQQTAVVNVENCIGCSLCVKICPVDAFIGILNYEHQVIESDCTGCQLCIPVCPTQCISMEERTKPLPSPDQNREHIARKEETKNAIKEFKMKNHKSSLALHKMSRATKGSEQ